MRVQFAAYKWLGANKDGESFPYASRAQLKKEHANAQNEDQERGEETLPRPSRWNR
jgi:hypothetical protein